MARSMQQSINRVGTWTWEVRPDRVLADPLTASYFGMEAEEGASGQPMDRYLKAIHNEDRNRVATAVRKSVVNGEGFCQTYRVHTLHGNERLIRAEGRCFRDDLGRPSLFPGHVADISDYLGDCGSIDDLRDLLDRALLSAQQMSLPLVMHFLAMATLEVSEIRQQAANVVRRLN